MLSWRSTLHSFFLVGTHPKLMFFISGFNARLSLLFGQKIIELELEKIRHS